MHRDIKLENMLITGFRTNGPMVKLTDFGFATKFEENQKLEGKVGSRYYMAPEVI